MSYFHNLSLPLAARLKARKDRPYHPRKWADLSVYGRPGNYNPASKDGRRWVEKVSQVLRYAGDADKLAGLRHTGWYTDDFCQETLRGGVWRLPHGRLVAGYHDPSNPDCARIDFSSVYEGDNAERDAAYAADRMAERDAEIERAYQEAWQAGAEWRDLGEQVAQCRGRILALLRERRMLRHITAPAICSEMRAKVKSLLSGIGEMRERRQELWNQYESWSRRRDDQSSWRGAFRDAAGLPAEVPS